MLHVFVYNDEQHIVNMERIWSKKNKHGQHANNVIVHLFLFFSRSFAGHTKAGQLAVRTHFDEHLYKSGTTA